MMETLTSLLKVGRSDVKETVVTMVTSLSQHQHIRSATMVTHLIMCYHCRLQLDETGIFQLLNVARQHHN